MEEDNLDRIIELTDKINGVTTQSEYLAMKIHGKISSIGLPGQQGILRDILPLQNLEQIFSNSKYTLMVLQKIVNILNTNPELTNKIKYK